jgi:hypothetical protein
LIVPCLGLLWLLAGALQPADERLLIEAGLSLEDLEKASGDRVAAKVLETEDRREIAVLAHVRVRATAERFLECVRDPRCQGASEDLVAAGRLEGETSGLDLLPLDDRELDQLRACRPGDCALRLSGEPLARLSVIDWALPGAATEAAALYRRTLASYASAYRRDGNRALPVYESGRVPTSLPDSLAELLKRPLLGLDEAPELRRYLADFPREGPALLEDYLGWYKERVWRKRVMALVHVVVQDRSAPGETRILAASKQLYASQCYDSAVDLLLFSCPPGDDRASLVFMSRARTDVRPSGFSWIERLLVRKLVRRRLESRFRLLKERLETPRAPLPARAGGTQNGAGAATPSETRRR